MNAHELEDKGIQQSHPSTFAGRDNDAPCTLPQEWTSKPSCRTQRHMRMASLLWWVQRSNEVWTSTTWSANRLNAADWSLLNASLYWVWIFNFFFFLRWDLLCPRLASTSFDGPHSSSCSSYHIYQTELNEMALPLFPTLCIRFFWLLSYSKSQGNDKSHEDQTSLKLCN